MKRYIEHCDNLLKNKEKPETFVSPVSAFGSNRVLRFITLLLASASFVYLAYGIVARYNENQIVQSNSLTNTGAIPLALARMEINIANNSAIHPTDNIFRSIQFKEILNFDAIPIWSFNENSESNSKRTLTVNQVNSSIKFKTSDWPLQLKYEKSYSQALMITMNGNFYNFAQSPDYIYVDDRNDNKNSIKLMISNFEVDSITLSADYSFRLLPCEQLLITITLEKHEMLNSNSNPCRNDFPDNLLPFFQYPMLKENLQNAVHASKLPYDKPTCEHICAVKYWLENGCKCYLSSESWHYAGRPKHTPICARTGENCTQSNLFITPSLEIKKCGCYQKCNGHRIRLVGVDKQRYSLGD